MKILIFGGAGFLGTHLAKNLIQQGHKVTIFDKYFKKKKVKKLKIIEGNILNYKKVKKTIKNQDVVFNFAAISDIEESIKKPLLTAKINILGNMNVASACVESKVKKLIFASTIYVHSSQGGFYRVSKQSSELFLEEYYKRNKLNYTVLRFGTIYGKNSSNKNGLKKIIFTAIKKEKLEYSGSSRARRRYLHVDDAIFACIKTIRKKYDNKNILITGENTVKVKKVLNIVSKKLKLKKKSIFKNLKGLGHYDSNPYTDRAKKEEKFYFNSPKKIENGIDELISHIKKN